MSPPDPGAAYVIGEAIGRLRDDYDLALFTAGGDENLVTLYLPGEWTILARRVCELIVAEVTRRAVAGAARAGAGPVECAACGVALWRVYADPGPVLMRRTECARCGAPCHV